MYLVLARMDDPASMRPQHKAAENSSFLPLIQTPMTSLQ